MKMIDPKSLRIGNYSPLFQEIMGAMYEPLHATISQEDAEKAARAIEERVMPWIEKAFCDAYIIGVHDGSIAEKKHNYNNIGPNYSKENWLKENGLTPTEPDTKEPICTETNSANLTYQGNSTFGVIGSNGIINGEFKDGD